MANQATITINDGATTPVAHNFTPSGIDKNEVAIYHDRVGGTALGFPRVQISLRRPVAGGTSSTSDRVYRARIKVDVPTLESSVTPPTLAYNCTVNVEFVLPERATQQNRKDVLAFVKNLLANAAITSAVQDLEPVF